MINLFANLICKAILSFVIFVTLLLSSKSAFLKSGIPITGEMIDLTISNQISVSKTGDHQFTIVMPIGSDLTSLKPDLKLIEGTTSIPASGQQVDFSSGFKDYSLITKNGSNSSWRIIVTYPLIEADNKNIHYTGRIDFSDVKNPKFSAAGVYIQAKFKGTFCDVDIINENLFGQYLNFIEVVIDDQKPLRIKMDKNQTTIRVTSGLPDTNHTILICKDTEAAIGWLAFKGFRCEQLLPLTNIPERKIECYGNSITCGAKMIADLCDSGTESNWNITNKAYMSYGAIAARKLNARWQLTSYSGIGLVKSCCNLAFTLPDIYDHIFLEKASSPKWNFSNYIPDVITICLGQNDGIIDSAIFCTKYIRFIQALRGHYPNAVIFCLTSPMGDDNLFNFQKKCLTSIVDHMNNMVNDKKVFKVYLTNKLNAGCGSHPDEAQHNKTAEELTAVIKEKMGW